MRQLSASSLVRKYWPNEDPIGQTIQFRKHGWRFAPVARRRVVGDVHDYESM